MRKTIGYQGLVHLVRLTLLAAGVTFISACQLKEIASYRWHNAGQAVNFAGKATKASVPFNLMNQHILVDVMVNQQGPFRFVLDSGAAATVITQSAATQSLKLPTDNPLQISGAGEGRDPTAYVVHDLDVSIGHLSISGLSAFYAPTDALPFDSQQETYFDGVLGADFFNCCVVEIDHDNQLLTFHAPDSADIARFNQGDWQQLVMQVDDNTPFVVAHVDDGRQRKAAKVMLDTGSTGTLSLFVGDNDFSVPEQTYAARSSGISGDSHNQVGYLKQLILGQHAFEQLPVYFRTQGDNPQYGSHGVLGNRVMQRFNQVFDFQGERYWIQPNARLSAAIQVDRGGVRLLPHVHGAIVKDIAPDTGAAQLPLVVNNVVTHIDGEAITPDTFDTLVARLQEPDRDKVSLCWWQEKTKVCESLALKDRLAH